MKEYLQLMRDGREKLPPVRSINWSVLDTSNILVEDHSKHAGLQIADVMTSAVFLGLEPNFYGNYEPRYGLEIANRFIRRQGRVLDYGLTLIPPFTKNPLDAEQRLFLQAIEEKSGRPPAPDPHRKDAAA